MSERVGMECQRLSRQVAEVRRRKKRKAMNMRCLKISARIHVVEERRQHAALTSVVDIDGNVRQSSGRRTFAYARDFANCNLQVSTCVCLSCSSFVHDLPFSCFVLRRCIVASTVASDFDIEPPSRLDSQCSTYATTKMSPLVNLI